ncbi:hypothetical protein [Helicobacter labetoulli]|uniref:hypothetical protein n=1 Tax=Helicobacter labetoulli TaxID=2315333 RepID=UPI000EF659F2|nr:hypothetical protein [Helicobacter labetoulli]
MNEAISKEQYRLKAKIIFFLFSKINIFILFFAYIITDSLDGFVILYAGAGLIIYRFVFSQTKMDNPYKIFLLQHISNFLKNSRKK